jgi:hypothetical protein
MVSPIIGDGEAIPEAIPEAPAMATRKMHRCERCEYVTEFSTHLRRHMVRRRGCTSEKPVAEIEDVADPAHPETEAGPSPASDLKCAVCERAFKSVVNLKRHVDLLRCPGFPLLACARCRVRFNTMAARQMHVHHGCRGESLSEAAG